MEKDWKEKRTGSREVPETEKGQKWRKVRSGREIKQRRPRSGGERLEVEKRLKPGGQEVEKRLKQRRS